MSKTKKVLIIVFASLFVAASISIGVLYYFYPEAILQYINNAWEWVNKPLPVVGISVLFILVFMFKIFAESSLGKKKLGEFNRKTDDIKADFNELVELFYQLKTECEKTIADKEKEIKDLKNVIKEICDKIPNKKIKAIGEKYYGEGKERINNETKAD